MSDANDKNDGPKGDNTRAPLTLKPRVGGSVSTGTVKQSFSHGRSKTVVVETKRRIGVPPAGGSRIEGNMAAPKPQNTQNQGNNQGQSRPQGGRPPQGGNPGGLRQEELDARRRVIEQARVDQERREAETRQRQQADAARRAAEDASKPAPASEPVKSEASAPVATPAPTPAPEPVKAETPSVQLN
ncbi:MAG: hypothetical protein B7Z26_10185, partial [Asticcacaulis sp. 32-58-5]